MADLGTRTVAEVGTLAGMTVRRVRARGAALVLWFCLGWAVHQAGLTASALLGVQHAVAANLVFVLAVVARLVSLVLMVHAVAPRPDVLTGPAADGVPLLRTPERPIDVVTLAVGPFLAVYAVWGFVDDEVSALFRSNYLLLGLGDVQRWSISLDAARLPFYLGLAAAGWVLRAAVHLVLRRRPLAGVAALGVLAEGVWAFSVFVVLLVVARAVRGWLLDRLAWAEVAAAGQRLLAALPDLTLPFGPTLRNLVTGLVTVAPGVLATVVLLPLMWLALAATVYGWREHRAADVVAGTRFAAPLDRLSRLGTTPSGRLVLLATGDLRTKYVPVARALRMVLGSGPRLLGAYVLLAATVAAASNLLQIGLSLLVGPRSPAVTLLLDPVQDLLVTLPVTVVSVALYGAAFERAVTGAGRASGPRRRPAAGPAPDLAGTRAGRS